MTPRGMKDPAAVETASAAVEPDAALAAMETELQRLRDESDRLSARRDQARAKGADTTTLDNEQDGVLERTCDLQDRIMETPAQSIADIAVKLRLVVRMIGHPGRSFEDEDWEAQLVWRIRDDAERLAKEGGP